VAVDLTPLKENPRLVIFWDVELVGKKSTEKIFSMSVLEILTTGLRVIFSATDATARAI
jgi:hypothetical protein